MQAKTISVAVMILASPALAGPPEGTYLIPILGQSNASGSGLLSEIPAGFPVNATRIWNFANDYCWKPLVSPYDSAFNQKDRVSADTPSSRYGADYAVSMADTLADALPMDNIGVIPCAKGGDTLEQHARNPDNPLDTTTLYGSCLSRIKQVLANNRLDVIVYDQGASDTHSEEEVDNWLPQAVALVKNFRSDLMRPHLKFIFVVIQACPATANCGRWYRLQALQRTLPSLIPGVTTIEQTGYEEQSGGGHLTTKGLIAFGHALGQAIQSPGNIAATARQSAGG